MISREKFAIRSVGALAQSLLPAVAVPMLSRAVACWLIVLVLAPFTAPFSTCDVATVLGRRPTHPAGDVAMPCGRAVSRRSPIAPTSPALSHEAAVVTAPAVMRGARTRLSTGSRAATVNTVRASVPGTGLTTSAAGHDFRQHACLTAVLRV